MYFVFRPSKLSERETFYKEEFDIKKLNAWFKKGLPQFFAIDYGSETKITKYENKLGKMIILQPNISLNTLKKKLLHYLPEDVYYDRNIYKNPKKCFQKMCFKKCMENNCPNWVGQELAFDIDAENIKCKFHKKERFNFCQHCLKEAIKQGIKLYKILEKDFGFKKLKLVYSGRGCHIHVMDKHAYKLSMSERNELTKKIKLGIDPWVSKGGIRLIRLPYSLNALVSRIVTPFYYDKAFNPSTSKKSIPKFLKEKTKEFQIIKI